jgi:hypothetical protein
MTPFVIAVLAALLSEPFGAHYADNIPAPAVVKDATPCGLGKALAVAGMAAPRKTRIFDEEAFTGAQIVRSRPVPQTAPVGVPSELVARWDAGPATSLLEACPEVRAALRAKPMATPEDRARVRGLQHGPHLMQVSAPLVGKSGQDVLIEVRFQCAGLCESGTVLLYRKTPDGWVRMDVLTMFVS